MKSVVIVTSRTPRRRDAFAVLRDATVDSARRVGQEVDVISILDVRSATGSIQECISHADIVLADVSDSRQDVMYEVGFAHASDKPTILVSDDTCPPTLYDLSMLRVLLYSGSAPDRASRERLVAEICQALKEPDGFTLRARVSNLGTTTPTVFVSYSRADVQCLERLRVHLRPLEREGAIEFWDDRRIQAGQDWRRAIQAALARARIAVLLVSADFLASEFVLNNELPVLLLAAQKDGTTILPVILKPCRFLRDTRLSVFQSINDPRQPLLALPMVDQEEIYARIADRVENELREAR